MPNSTSSELMTVTGYLQLYKLSEKTEMSYLRWNVVTASIFHDETDLFSILISFSNAT